MASERGALDPDMWAIVERAAGGPPMTELDPEQARARTRAGNALCDGGPREVEASDVPIAGGPLTGRRYEPPGGSYGTVVYFHGGGWVTGDLDYSGEICRWIAATAGTTVLSVAYRLAPEHPFPAAVEDARTAVRWAAASREPPVVVAGDSSGGNLAAVCAPEFDLAGQLLIYPCLDADLDRPSYERNSGKLIGRAEMTWFFDHYCPDPADRRSPLFAPLRGDRLAAVPPTVVVLAGHDPLRDEGEAYARALPHAEVREFPTLTHGFLRFTSLVPAAAEAARAVATYAAALVHDKPVPR